MTREEKLETLAHWQEFAVTAKALKSALRSVIGNPQEMPFVDHYDKLYDDYTALVATLVNDHGERLEWYAWENDFGASQREAGVDGNLKPIKTFADLLWCIETHNQATQSAIEFDEARIDTIGQNGNEGLHYAERTDDMPPETFGNRCY